MKNQLDYLKFAKAQAILNCFIHHMHQYYSVYSTWKFKQQITKNIYLKILQEQYLEKKYSSKVTNNNYQTFMSRLTITKDTENSILKFILLG